MQKLTNREYKQDEYHLHLIETKKFKTNLVALKFAKPLDRESITKRALLPFVLQKGTKTYPTEKELRLKLDALYGSKFSINSGKKGENHVITFVLDFPNDKFIPNAHNLVKDCLTFLYDVAANPNVENRAFDENVVDKEKETLTNKIKSIVDEKMQYANMRLIDEMCKDEKYSVHAHGYLEDMDQIDAQSLYETYEQMINEDALDIFFVGDFEQDQVKQVIEDVFTFNRQPKTEIFRSEPKQVNEVEDVTEKQKVQQAKLHMGYRTGITYSDQDYPALQLFNGIFGGFPHSKLFLNVREKHSLAYYAASRIESNKGLMLVFSGIAPDKYDQAREIIIQQHEDMKAGNITDEEIDQTKKAIIHQIKENIDRAGGMVEFFYQQVIADHRVDTQDMLEEIESITKEDVVRVANRVELDTVYFLTAEDGGEASE
ncbi:EF-P 5-aminopentanol modification-associated protein YfmF [Tenuibacillus multivorans]|uniref:Predicted Zn-dependent peptidase n=1 Tax=Tenuibacillus multivorans TaxID=237069 RepID=A0A1G9XTU2_9BACI|nr:pitrilysin family protein [Tenuibacillus multivorans]GEL75814.1 putative inactive metalloprotease YmfF [Tenuibacillus multivorans]SDN00218.1 Predicted Zn-dependent peptidase [Tenuibacillus multivorans]